MIIVFDFEVTDTHFDFPPDELEKLSIVRDFVYDRVKVLEDRINQFPKAGIVINVMDTLRHYNDDGYVPIGMHYQGFSKELETKLKECVTEQDWNYIRSVIRHNDL